MRFACRINNARIQTHALIILIHIEEQYEIFFMPTNVQGQPFVAFPWKHWHVDAFGTYIYPIYNNNGRSNCVSMATVDMRTRYSVTLFYVVCLALLTPDGIMVTVCTTRFNIQQFYVLPTQCVWISEQTAIISVYSINWLVFITEI
jgi:hypothetical protein